MRYHAQPVQERRTLERVACAYPATVRTIAHSVQAGVTDVGRGGFRIELSRALVPGHYVMLCVRGREEFKARVVWCRYEHGQARFEAGVRVLHDHLDVAAEVSEVLYDAIEASGATAALYDEVRDVPLAWSA